ncbi:pseudouridine synthase [Leptolyngbya cf. ectocarpi LEGE 11479]|uniref:Pseudouridine synthase n=1 Tax=Leptolyngbya cf. ectocarpi LEGE 11479 TaxID=1828722 RepID=A0A928WXY9_LEPEC|nr:pseudouridine synthase [Leptolyngbya ectocarpi]MBE9065469.1 pseudouridine synthase [Leptolyngbya cf. ectocarpi LEGE 11479]
MDYRYLVFYKPYDVLSQFTDADRTTLKSFIPVSKVYPVGRLDRDSEGLLLLTNDGQLQNRLCHPRFRHPRTYWAQVERIPDATSLERLRQGVVIRGYTTLPAEVTLLSTAPSLPPRTPPIRFRKQVPTAWLQLTLREGKNRQVRRMTAAVGFPTLRLVRVGIGSLHLGDLQPGQWRYLTPDEQQHLHQLGQLTKGCDRPHASRRKRFQPRSRQRYN